MTGDLIAQSRELLRTKTDLATIDALRKAGHSQEDVREAINQVHLQRAAHAAWTRSNASPEAESPYHSWRLTRDGLEQASHPAVADFRASVIGHQVSGAQPLTHVLDLTAGLGSDSAGFLRAGFSVTAVERDPTVARYLEHNLAVTQELTSQGEFSVIVGDCVEIAHRLLSDELAQAPTHGVAVFLDPARRSGARNATGDRALPERDPERWSPPWSFVLDLAQNHPVFMKAAPAFNPPPGWGHYAISLDGALVESFVTNRAAGHHAVLIDTSHVTVVSAKTDIGVTVENSVAAKSIGSYLFELDPALTRLRLGTQVAADHRLQELGEKGMWLTGDAHDLGPLGRAFRVQEVFPSKEIARVVKDLPGVALKTKDSHHDHTQLRHKAKKGDSNSWAVILTSLQGKEIAVLAQRDNPRS